MKTVREIIRDRLKGIAGFGRAIRHLSPAFIMEECIPPGAESLLL
jgi:hypothetical protein